MPRTTCLVVASVLALGLAAGASAQEFTDDFLAETCTFTPTGDHPLWFSLEPGGQWYYEGDEDGTPIAVEITVLDELQHVEILDSSGMPRTVATRIIEEREWEDDELVEVSRNFFARCRENGSIFYFGEDVDDYEDGEVVGHGGAWRSGVDDAVPGVIMPGTFTLGSAYFQEVAPEIALDRALHVAMGLDVDVMAGSFSRCVEVVETTPLDLEEESVKQYCPGVGMVVDDELELTWFDRPVHHPPVAGDVAPGVLDDSTTPPTWHVTGNGRVDIGDVVIMLRASVGLHAFEVDP